MNRNSTKKGEKGAITLFVLLACLFFTLILVGTYISSLGKLQTQEQNIEQIQENYAREISQKDEIYEKLAKNSTILLKANPLTKTKEVTLTGNATIKGGDDVKITAWAITKGNATTPPSSSEWNNITPVNEIEITKNVTENGEYTFWIKDSDGEILPSRTITISNIDTISPEPGTIIAKKNDENGEEISIPSNKTITSNENVYIEKVDGKDVDENGNEDSTSETTTTMTVKKDGLPYTDPEGKPTEKGEGPFKLTEDGTYTITVITEDEAGNSSENEYVIIIDKVVPVLVLKENSETGNTYQYGIWTNNDLYGSITIDTSKNGKQVEKYQYSTNGVVWFDISDTPDENGKINFNNYSKSDDKISFILQEDLEKSIYIRAVYTDKTSSKYADEKSIKIDKTAPEITETSSTTSSITFKATDGASGIIGYEITTNSTRPTEFTDCTKTYNLEKTIKGLKQETIYYVWVKDEAGNVNEIKTINTGEVTDLDSANTTFKQEPTGWTNQNVEVTTKTSVTGYTLQTTKTPSDENSWVTVNNSTGEPKQIFTKNGTLYARLTDGINVGEQATYNVNNIDKNAPVINTALNSSNVKSNEFTLNVEVTDALSGLGKIQWYYKSSSVSGYTMEEEIYTPLNGTKTGTTTAVTKSKTFTGLESGTYNAYVVIYDVAGNFISTESTLLNVTLNDIPLNITFNSNPSGWTNGNVIVDASTTEKGYTIQTSKDGTSWSNETSQTFTENGTIYARLTDGVNVGGIVTKDIDNIDKNAPTVSLSPNGGTYAMPTSGKATIKTTLSAEDTGGSDLNTLQYAWSTSNTTEPTTWKTFTNGETVSKTDCEEGTYYLWTNVTDKAGNIASSVKVSDTFTVSQSDENKIELRALTTDWTNEDVTVIAIFGSNLRQDKTLTSTGTSETDYTVNGTASVIVKTNNQTVTASAKDSVGNTVTATYKVTNIDKVSPTVSLSPNGGTYAMPTSGTATVKAKLTAEDTGGSELDILQYAWSASNTIEPTTWQTFTNSSEVSKMDCQEGTYYLWTNVTDKAGNRASTVKVSNAFTINNSSSLITFNAEPTDWTNGDVTVVPTYSSILTQSKTLTSTGTSGTDYTLNGTASIIVKTNNQTVTASAKDSAGNTVTATYKVTNIDKVSPTVSLSPNGGKYAMPTSGKATIKTTLTAEDTGGSELNTLQYAWSTSNTTEPTTWQTFTNSSEVSKTDCEEKTYYLWTNVTDKAGNRASTVKVSNAFTVSQSDENKITLSAVPTDWTNGDVIVTVTFGSNLTQNKTLTSTGILETDYTVNGTTSVTVKTNDQTVTASAKDLAGNTVTATYKVTNIDKLLPTVSVSPNGGTYVMPTSGKATIKSTLTAEDTGGSELNTLQYAWSTSNTTEPTTWQTFTSGSTVSKTDCTVGTYYLWTNVTDKAGNRATSVKVSNAFTVNNSSSLITFSAEPTGWTNGNVTVTPTYSSTLTQNKTLTSTGTSGTDYTLNGTTSVTVKTNNQTVTASAKDLVGNTVTATYKVTNIDKVLPTVSLSPNGGTYAMPTSRNATIKTTLTATDTGGSGLNILQYAWSTSNTTEPTTWKTFTSGSTVNKTDCTVGTYYLWTKVIDKAGNRATSVKVSNAFKVNSSSSLITFTADPTDWTNGDVTVKPTYSSILTQSKTLICTGTSGTDYTASGTTSVIVKTNNQTVTASAKDSAGNTVTATYKVTNIDRTGPTVNFGTNGNTTWGKSQSTTVKVTDAGSGVKASSLKYAWSTSTTTPTFSSTFSNNGTITKSSGTGKYYLYIQAEDNVGNVTTVKSNLFYIDNTKPTISSATPSATSAASFKFTVKASDAHSGLNKYLITDSSTTPTTSTSGWVSNTNSEFSKDGLSTSTKYYVYVQDKAGNISAATTVTTTSLNYDIDGTTWTETLEQAVNAAKDSGSTIKLLNNYTDTSTVNISKNVTFNTNGKTLKREGSITIKKSGVLAIIGNGTIEDSTNPDNVRTFNNFGTLNINMKDGTIRRTTRGWIILNNYEDSDGNLNITGGTIEYTSEDVGSVIINKYNMTMDAVTIISNGYGVVSRGENANMKITGGTIINNSSLTNIAAVKADLGGKAYLINTTVTAKQRAISMDKYATENNETNDDEPTNEGCIFLYDCNISSGKIFSEHGEISFGTVFEIAHENGHFIMRYYDNAHNSATVKLPTWTAANGQDDIIFYETAYGTLNGCGVYWTNAYKSEHNNETGTYLTHIYENDSYIYGFSYTP